MKWLALTMAMVVIAPPALYVQSQCFTDDDRFNIVLDTDLSGITDFGLDLLRELVPDGSQENVFFSPYSIWSALALAFFGSSGNTEVELQSALRVSSKIGTLRLWKALEITYQLRSLIGGSYTFNLANRIYVDENISFRTCIKGLLSNEVQYINFLDNVGASDKINDFVSDTTGGRITDLMTPDMLSDAQLVLVNAAYFKGVWQNQFDPKKTRSKDFTNGQITGKVKMMHLNTKLNYGKFEELGGHLLELPYESNVISMYLLLPFKAGDDEFNDVVQALNGSVLHDAMSNLVLKTVNLQLPKFSLETTLEDELSVALGNIGIVDLFNRTTADLTRFVENAELAIDKGIHKAFIEVSEEGVEAAAATALIISTRAGGGLPKDVIYFHCNRPFIYFLYDNDTNNVLFLGAFKSPQ